MNKLVDRLSQKVYYISFSHKRISKILDYYEKNDPSVVDKLVHTVENKKLENYHKLAGMLLVANIEKIGNKLIRTMKENEFRTKLAESFDKDENIKKILTKNKVSKSDITTIENEVVFDAKYLLKIGFDLDTIKDQA